MDGNTQEEDPIFKIRSWLCSHLEDERAAVQQQMVACHFSLLQKFDAEVWLQRAGCQSPRTTVDLDPAAGRHSQAGNIFKVSSPFDQNKDDDELRREKAATKIQAVFRGMNVRYLMAKAKEVDAPVQGNSKNKWEELDEQNKGACASEVLKEMVQDSVHLFRVNARREGCLKAVVDSPWFEAIFVFLVILNTMVSAVQAQYKGFDRGLAVDYPGYNRSAANSWPGIGDAFRVLECCFAALYTFELGCKLLGLRLNFFKDLWNIFDLGLVALWYLMELGFFTNFVDPMILRLCRLARLMRLVRHAGWFQAFDSLHMLISAIRSSLSVLVWSSLLLFTLLVIFALMLNGLLAGYLEGKVQGPEELDGDAALIGRRIIYSYFGTFSRSLISMFEISFASHVPICRAVMEHVGEEYAIIFVFYKCLVGLSVMKVITGVFLHETFKVCSEDDELMIIQKRRMVRDHMHKMIMLFSKVDVNGDGSISWEEFERVLHDDWVRTWLGAMELDPSSAERLWSLMDDGDGELSAEELVKGVSSLKGAAKSVDVHHCVKMIDKLRKDFDTMDAKVGKTYDCIQKNLGEHPYPFQKAPTSSSAVRGLRYPVNGSIQLNAVKPTLLDL